MTDNPPPSLPVAPKPIRVLIVEDHRDTMMALKSLLIKWGYDVTVTATGKGALAVAATQEFDLITSDIGLPDIDGYELLGKLRETQPHYVVAMALTAYNMPSHIDLARQAGFNGYLTKPFNSASLKEALQQVFAKPPPRL